MSAVIVGLVDRPEGWAALSVGATEAILRSARLVVVCSGVGSEEMAVLRQRIDAVLATGEYEGTSLVWEVISVSVGNSPVEDLIAAVEQKAAALLVIGLRRRTSVGKFLLGSDAQRILMLAQCPVMAVKE